MFCSKCGCKLDDGVKFCPNCGQKVVIPEVKIDEPEKTEEPVKNEEPENNEEPEMTEGSGRNEEPESPDEPFDWRAYLTMENVERFAPAVTLDPIIMAIVVGVLSRLLFGTVGMIGVGQTICKIVLFLVKCVFVGGSVAATVALANIALNYKDKDNINAWVAPFGTCMAALSCMGIAFGKNSIAMLFGIISVVLGIEFLVRIVIAGEPMDTPVDFSCAIASYKKFYSDYKEKYQNTQAAEMAARSEYEPSVFDGSGAELLGYVVLTVIVSVITCGLATPWMICVVYKWKIEHTVINGKRLTFTGTGVSLLGNWIVWEILTIVTCGLFALYAHIALRKWEVSHTYIAGEPIIANGGESYFDGSFIEYIGYSIVAGILSMVTCGLAYPWIIVMLQKWDAEHQVINGRRLKFSGSGLGFLGDFIIIVLLNIVTCGIYSTWGIVRLNKYIVSNTDFIN